MVLLIMSGIDVRPLCSGDLLVQITAGLIESQVGRHPQSGCPGNLALPAQAFGLLLQTTYIEALRQTVAWMLIARRVNLLSLGGFVPDDTFTDLSSAKHYQEQLLMQACHA
jgi:hypothetical protein